MEALDTFSCGVIKSFQALSANLKESVRGPRPSQNSSRESASLTHSKYSGKVLSQVDPGGRTIPFLFSQLMFWFLYLALTGSDGLLFKSV